MNKNLNSKIENHESNDENIDQIDLKLIFNTLLRNKMIN